MEWSPSVNWRHLRGDLPPYYCFAVVKLSASAYWQLQRGGGGGRVRLLIHACAGAEEGCNWKKINRFCRMSQVGSISYGMVDACLSFGRLRELNDAMNHGYNLKVAALADASLTLENAAARGNPFAASAVSNRRDTSSNTVISSTCPEQRLRQLNASMNEGYSEKLATMSPTRMQAAARGNPFAIFESNSWKLSGTRLQQPKLGKDVETGSKFVDRTPAVTSLLAHAAAQGNPFALSAASHTKNLNFVKTNENTKGFVANTKSKVEGQRLEASIMFERTGHQVATTAQSESIQKKVQKPLNLHKSSSISARLSKAPVSKHAKRSADAVAFDTLDPHFSDNETENPLGNLLEKRVPNHASLSITLPASPSESTRSHLLPHADDACGGALGDEVCLPPARDSPMVSNGDSSVEDAVEGSSAAFVASSADKHEPFHKPVEQLEAPSMTVLHQNPATTIDDAFFSLDLESQIRLLRRDLSGCGGGSSAGAAASAVQDTTCVSSARRSSSLQGGALEEGQDCPDMSPKTLFPDHSDYTTLAATRVPEEEPLACMVQNSLNLRHEVAVMVAGYMRETVRRNTAASADFRANFWAQALHQPQIRSTDTGVRQTLVMAERAMRSQAVADAEKQEETFHRKVADTQRKMK
jgi:hypothetical protein